MTFEEIHQCIASGVPAGSLAEVEAALDVLTGIGGNTPVKVALKIAEARAFRRDDRNFWGEAKERWKFNGEKTIYHYYGVGCLLIALRDFQGGSANEKECRVLENQARKCYARCLEIEFAKLFKLCTVANDRKRGIVEVMNFLKNHFRPEWSTREFIAKVDELYNYGRKGESEQLTFKFDIFEDVSPEAVAGLFARDVGAAYAMQIVSNGALWCRSAARQLVAHADEFAPEALSEFERLSAELDEAKRHLDGVIAARKREALGLLN